MVRRMSLWVCAGSEDSVQGQSFRPGECTPELAHNDYAAVGNRVATRLLFRCSRGNCLDGHVGRRHWP
jgi:hypothetical protein